MTARRRGLSKSKIQAFRQCPKRLYLAVHGESLGLDRLQSDIGALQALNGEEVGTLAHSLYGPGQLIGTSESTLAECLAQTAAALPTAGTLFEATFEHDGILVRADVLSRTEGKVDLVEVKSSTLNTYQRDPVKQHTLIFDSAIQAWVIGKAGLPVKSVRLAMVDSGFEYAGGGQYDGLLAEVDVTDEALDLADEVARVAEDARRTLSGELPDTAMGPQCTKPYPCPFQDYCAPRDGPEYPSRRLLTLGNRANRALIEEIDTHGWEDLREVPEDLLSDERDRRIWTAVTTGQAVLRDEARDWARALPFPRYYIDFETIQFAVPIWKGTRPYEQIPFQWSCHIEHADGRIEHQEFLASDGEDPRRDFAESLVHVLGDSKSPILVYNQAMEATVIRRLAASFTNLEAPLMRLIDRIHDLLPIMRSHYYHPDMQGSWSIKAVVPTLAPDMDYARLEGVKEGGDAQLAYRDLMALEDDDERKAALRESLIRYCSHETLAMVRIVQALSEVT